MKSVSKRPKPQQAERNSKKNVDKKARLAEALRRNLAKRKRQSRAQGD